MAIDDDTRLAYVEVLPDVKHSATAGFLLCAVAWFDGQGITCWRVLCDDGSAYRFRRWLEAFGAMGLMPKRSRSHTSRTNGKDERFIKTPLAEWANSMAFQTSAKRVRWLPAIWGLIPVTGVMWRWLAALPFSNSGCCYRMTW